MALSLFFIPKKNYCLNSIKDFNEKNHSNIEIIYDLQDKIYINKINESNRENEYKNKDNIIKTNNNQIETKMKKIISNPKMKTLVDNLKFENIIKSEKVYNAMLFTDRGDFCPSNWAYYDSPQSIDYNATISAPHMHAYALEYLKDYLKPGGRALDVGSGSGYLTLAFSRMMEDKGISVGIEHIHELYELGLKNISKHNQELIDEGKIVLLEGDGRYGYKDLAPYDCIHVGASADKIPEDLVEQLAKGGRLMIPVGGQMEAQYVYLIDKDLEGNVVYNKLLPVRYVPLTSKEKQLKYYSKGDF